MTIYFFALKSLQPSVILWRQKKLRISTLSCLIKWHWFELIKSYMAGSLRVINVTNICVKCR